jgi:AMP nucleosidase
MDTDLEYLMGPFYASLISLYTGSLKLPGMASEFYKTQVSQHLSIGVRTMEILQEMPLGRLQSRKLRSFNETAFL